MATAFSDEEAAGAGTPGLHRTPFVHLSSSKSQHLPHQLLAAHELCYSTQKLTRYLYHLSRFHSGVPDVVTFEVGGVEFMVHRDTLEKDPQSFLFALVSRHYPRSNTGWKNTRRGEHRRHKRSRENAGDFNENPCRDGVSDNIVIPGKDPTIFAMILNFLRGYVNAIRSPAWKEACEADVRYYGLWKSWSTRYSPSVQYKFAFTTTGPQLFSDLVCGIASPYFSSGMHAITFAVIYCDKAAVGVSMESEHDLPRDIVQEGHGKVLYWNDGKITSSLGEPKVTDTSCPFSSPTEIQVYLDSDINAIRWVINGDDCVGMQRLTKGKPFAFCAVAARVSQIDILYHRSANYL